MNKGLVIVFTGDGKGKTTSALGIALRACGHNMKVVMLQFIKGSWHYGELESVKKLSPNFELIPLGKGFVGIIDDRLPREEHIKAAKEALGIAREKITSGNYRIVILDEINVAVRLNLIDIEDLLDLVKAKPERLHLIITGRGADPKLIEAADLVTEMREIKHPYQKGIEAQRGIDY
ncbi:MAG: cob(I)yrinic acid a,c-diamide adenosyltransferase [Nitrospirota bacterium]